MSTKEEGRQRRTARRFSNPTQRKVQEYDRRERDERLYGCIVNPWGVNVETMSYSEVAAFIVLGGKYDGETVAAVWNKDARYVRWYASAKPWSRNGRVMRRFLELKNADA